MKPLVYDINPTDMKYFRIHITRHGNLDAGGSWFSSLGELELFAMVEEKPEEEGELAVNKYALRMNPGETDWLYRPTEKRSRHTLSATQVPMSRSSAWTRTEPSILSPQGKQRSSHGHGNRENL